MNRNLILCVLFALIQLTSCHKNNIVNQKQKIINKLAKKYPAFKYNNKFKNYKRDFDLLDKITYYKMDLTYEFYRLKRNIYNQATYLVFISRKNKIHALPIFPFTNKCYWQHEGYECRDCIDSLSFNSEYQKTLKNLDLEKTNSDPFLTIFKYIYPYYPNFEIKDTSLINTNCSFDKKAFERKKFFEKQIQVLANFIELKSGMGSKTINPYVFTDYTRNTIISIGEVYTKAKKGKPLKIHVFSFSCPEIPVRQCGTKYY